MADLDTASKRASSVQMLLWGILAPVLPDGTIAQADRQHQAHAYSGIAAVSSATPTDDDADTTYTTYVTAEDAATIRAGRITLRYAPDSAATSALANAERLAADRYITRSLRSGRGRTLARSHSVILETSRAGEAWSLRSAVVQFESFAGDQRPYAANTTSASSVQDSATLAIPTLHTLHAADSVLNTSLQPSATDQDRWRTDHFIGSTSRTGATHRLIVADDGRAGNAWSLLSAIAQGSIESTGDTVVKVTT